MKQVRVCFDREGTERNTTFINCTHTTGPVLILSCSSEPWSGFCQLFNIDCCCILAFASAVKHSAADFSIKPIVTAKEFNKACYNRVTIKCIDWLIDLLRHSSSMATTQSFLSDWFGCSRQRFHRCAPYTRTLKPRNSIQFLHLI